MGKKANIIFKAAEQYKLCPQYSSCSREKMRAKNTITSKRYGKQVGFFSMLGDKEAQNPAC